MERCAGQEDGAPPTSRAPSARSMLASTLQGLPPISAATPTPTPIPSPADARTPTENANTSRPWRARELDANVVVQLSKGLIPTYKMINANYYKKHKITEDGLLSHKKGKEKELKASEDYELLEQEEIFHGRYKVRGKKLGNGSFGLVVEALDMETGMPVAIKIVKKNVKFAKQAQIEIDILKRLHTTDDIGRRYIVQLLDDFVHKGHVCMVFERYHSNLYELLRKTQHKGISLKLLRKFTRQILLGLLYLSRPNVNVIHCDLKPENILLVHPTRSQLKIIDFGSACQSRRQVFTYIQSRFYRSPEVLLGLDYTCGIDMWSLGCILVEMHIGHPLFGGCDQYDQMRRIVNVLGMPPRQMIDRVNPTIRQDFFDEMPAQNGNAQDVEYNVRIRKRPSAAARLGGESEFQTTLWNIVGGSTGGPKGYRMQDSGHSEDDYRIFVDLVSRMLRYDVSERISPAEALQHPFFSAYRPEPKEKKAKQARSNNMRDVYTAAQPLRHDMERVKLRRTRERRDGEH